jgi:type I restriction enzyme S subunit
LPPIKEEEIPFALPEGWEWSRLGEVIIFSDNLDIQAKLKSSDLVNYVDIEAIDNKNHAIREIKQKKVSELSSRARRVLEKGNIMYSLVRPYLNNLAIIEEEKNNFIGSTGFAVFRGVKIENNYIFYFLLSDYINKLYLKYMSGFNSPGISFDKFKSTLLPLPPIKEQKEIVKKVDELMKMVNDLEVQIKENKTTADLLMQSVLREAFSK